MWKKPICDELCGRDHTQSRTHALLKTSLPPRRCIARAPALSMSAETRTAMRCPKLPAEGKAPWGLDCCNEGFPSQSNTAPASWQPDATPSHTLRGECTCVPIYTRRNQLPPVLTNSETLMAPVLCGDSWQNSSTAGCPSVRQGRVVSKTAAAPAELQRLCPACAQPSTSGVVLPSAPAPSAAALLRCCDTSGLHLPPRSAAAAATVHASCSNCRRHLHRQRQPASLRPESVH